MKKIIFIVFLIAVSCLSCVSAENPDNATDVLTHQDVQNPEEAIEIDDNEVLGQANDSDVLQTQSKADSISSPGDSSAYLVLDNDADKENIYLGDYVTWIISAANKGPDTAKNVKIHNKLPDGLKYIRHNLTKGKFNPKTGIWDIGDLSNGSEVFLYITTLAVSAGEKINRATLTSDTHNLNDERYEEEEIDVFGYPDKDFSKKYHSYSIKTVGNPIGLIILSILCCLGSVRKN